MTDFSDAEITRMAQRAEILLTAEADIIFDRISFNVAIGQSEFTLPSRVIDIKKITWKGKKLDPFPGLSMIESDSTPMSTAQGLPKFYTYDYKGYPAIKIYPAPGEALSSFSGDLWSISAIESSFIVEFITEPDFTSVSLRIPEDIRRQHVKEYVSYRLWQREGKANDPAAAKYYKMKFEMAKLDMREIRSNSQACIPRVSGPEDFKARRIGRAVLPPQFGWKEPE